MVTFLIFAFEFDITLQFLFCNSFHDFSVGKIHPNERAVYVLGSMANVAAGCTTLALNHLQLVPTKKAIVECIFAS